MTELRQNPATREWVLFAPGRSRRPKRKLASARVPLITHDPACPFCPGQEESGTLGETLRYFSEPGVWSVRAFPNKFPALSPSEYVERSGDGLSRRMRASGHHEVICESRLHNAALASMSVLEVEQVVRAWHARCSFMRSLPHTDHVSLFKNHGALAGSSIAHPHSQIVTVPVVPWQVRHRLAECARYYDDTGRCVICDILHTERASEDRLVCTRPSFTAFVPYAADRPSTVWLVPHDHAGCFSQMDSALLGELAGIMREVLLRLCMALNDPPFNLIFRVANRSLLGTEFSHWHIAIIPRLSMMSGFELATGMFINSSWPEHDARVLRDVEL